MLDPVFGSFSLLVSLP